MGNDNKQTAGPSEAGAIAFLNDADFSRYTTSETTLDDERDPQPAPEAESPAEDAEPEEQPQAEDEPEQQDEQPHPKGKNEPTSRAKAPSPTRAGAGATPVSDPLAGLREKVKKARDTYGNEMIDDLGLEDLISAVEKSTAPIREAQARHEEARRAEVEQATRMVTTFLDKAAGSDPELASILGKTGKTTDEQLAMRDEVLAAAQSEQRAAAAAVRAGRRKAPMSDTEALEAGLAKVTGKSATPGTTQVAAYQRMARRGSGNAGASSKADTEAARISTVHEQINSYLQGRRDTEAA